MQTSMQNEKESKPEAEKPCASQENQAHPQPKPSNKQQRPLSDLLKNVGDCV